MIQKILLIVFSFFLLMNFFNCTFPKIQIENKSNKNNKPEVIQFSPKEDRWAIVIGISKYQNSKHNLYFSDKDAIDFNKALIEKCRFKNDHINLLINEKATYENIRRSIEGWTIKNIINDDNLVIYFSGHGMRDLDDNNDEDDGLDEFLVPYDYQDDDISSAIRDDVFAYWLNSIKAKTIIIFLDSCFSGGAAKGKGITNTRISIKDLSLLDDLEKDIYGEVPNKKTILISASKSNQVSSEDYEFKNGVFTNFLLDSINKNSDLDFNNIITTKEIFNFINEKIPQYTKTKKMPIQEPNYINSTSIDFDFAYLPLEVKTEINDNYDNLLKLAQTEKSHQKKIEFLKRAISINPKEFNIFSSIAWEYYLEKDYRNAIYNFDAGISVIEKINNDKKKNGIEKYTQEYYDKMKKSNIKSISHCYERMEDFKTAIDFLKKAINIIKEEDDFEIYNSLGYLYELINDLENAKISYITSINLFNIQSEAYVNLARLLIKLKQYNEASATIKRGFENHPDEFELNYLNYLIEKYLNQNLDIANKIYIKLSENIELKNYLKEIEDLMPMSKFKENKYYLEFLERIIKNNIYFIEAYIEYLNYTSSNEIYRQKHEEMKNKLLLIYPFMIFE